MARKYPLQSTAFPHVYRMRDMYVIKRNDRLMVPRDIQTYAHITPGARLSNGEIVQEIRENSLVVRHGWEDFQSDFESAGVMLDPI